MPGIVEPYPLSLVHRLIEPGPTGFTRKSRLRSFITAGMERLPKAERGRIDLMIGDLLKLTLGAG